MRKTRNKQTENTFRKQENEQRKETKREQRKENAGGNTKEENLEEERHTAITEEEQRKGEERKIGNIDSKRRKMNKERRQDRGGGKKEEEKNEEKNSSASAPIERSADLSTSLARTASTLFIFFKGSVLGLSWHETLRPAGQGMKAHQKNGNQKTEKLTKTNKRESFFFFLFSKNIKREQNKSVITSKRHQALTRLVITACAESGCTGGASQMIRN